MANSNAVQFAHDSEIWQSLKQAIAHSSGFKSWLKNKGDNSQLDSDLLDVQILNYLRETLETLAY